MKKVKEKIKSVYGDIGDGFKVVLSKEIEDRDGEVVDIDGISIENYVKNPVLLDSHNIHGSVADNVLGRMSNINKTKDASGIKMLSGTAEFADTPSGKIARMLVENGFVKTVSIGFAVSEYDTSTNRISKSELYETSLVSVPANVQATIGKSLKDNEKLENVIEKRLKNYNYIKPVLKEYRGFVQDDALRTMLGYEPTGDELIDLKNIFDLINLRLKAEDGKEEQGEELVKPSENHEDPKSETITITKEELSAMMRDTVDEVLQNLT